MSFITVQFVKNNQTKPIDVIVSSVHDAFHLGMTLDLCSDVSMWRIKNIEGGLKFNFGWSPESEWNKYQQDFASIFVLHPPTTSR